MSKPDLNVYLMSFRDEDGIGRSGSSYPLSDRIVCEDGFSISVQATEASYCYPRCNRGPWMEVECGYPSDVPVGIMKYAESPERPTSTVYGYVPIELVESLIEGHGGMVTDPERRAEILAAQEKEQA